MRKSAQRFRSTEMSARRTVRAFDRTTQGVSDVTVSPRPFTACDAHRPPHGFIHAPDYVAVSHAPGWTHRRLRSPDSEQSDVTESSEIEQYGQQHGLHRGALADMNTTIDSQASGFIKLL